MIGTTTVLSRLLSLVLLALLLAPAPGVADNPPGQSNQHGRLWRIEGPGQQVSWLFATMHLSDPRVVRLSLAEKTALFDAKVLAVEIPLDGSATAAVLNVMFLPQGQNLSQKVPAEPFERLVVQMDKRGVPRSLLERLQAWAAWMVLCLPAEEFDRASAGVVALDARLIDLAQRNGTAVHYLETVEEQLASFLSLSEAEYVGLLLLGLDAAEEGNQEQITDYYLMQDLAGLQEFYEADRYLDPALFDSFSRHLIVLRNKRMLERMEPLLAAGGAFVAVGALHVTGDEGLLALLSEAGYRLSLER